MSIKAAGGVFGRNPTFNDLTVEGDLSVDGTLSVGGNVLSGLDFEGAWDATSGAPSATPSTGQFWIVSVAGTTNLSGITNWGIGDWALYDGSAWQRIEGGADGNFNQLTSSGTTILNGTTIPASKTLVVTTDIGSTVEAYDATILKSADIGSTVQGYDADTAKYDDTTANFTGTLQNGGSNVVVDTDIGSTVQAYDADTAKLDVNQTWTGTQAFNGAVVINEAGADVDFRVEGDTDDNLLFVDASTDNVGIGISLPASKLDVADTIQVTGDDAGSSSLFFGDSSDTNAGYILYNHASNYMSFRTNGTGEDLRLDSSGNFGIATTSPTQKLDVNGNIQTSGNLIIGTSGNGIDFSATSGTGTSELFDDYEEGTWSPNIKDSNSGSTIVIATNQGRYTKIGNFLYLEVAIYVNSISHTFVGYPYIDLPFAVGSYSEGAVFVVGYYSATGTAKYGYVSGSGDQIRLATSIDRAYNNTATGAVFSGNVRLYGNLMARTD
jgi:hypothetical protein